MAGGEEHPVYSRVVPTKSHKAYIADFEGFEDSEWAEELVYPLAVFGGLVAAAVP